MQNEGVTFYDDQMLVCQECKKEFVFEGGEQSFLRKLEADGKMDKQGRPVTYREPKRCRECRQARKNSANRTT